MRLFESLKLSVFSILILSCLSVATLLPANSTRAAELLVVEQDNCAYCEKFHAQIAPAYPKTDEGKRAPLRLIMIDDPMPEELIDVEPAFVTPTFILIQNNREVDRLVGYPGDEHFWFLLGEMLAKLEQ